MEDQYVAGWGTLTLINAGLAQGKNRSGLNWFFISILLGPIATFILVMMEKLPEENDEENDDFNATMDETDPSE